MRFKGMFTVLAASLLMFSAACHKPVQEKRTWMDLNEISQKIEKKGPESSVLEGNLTEPKQSSEEPVLQRIENPQGGENPFLQGVSPTVTKTAVDESEDEGILLNFDNADIFEVIQSIAEILDLNYIIDPQVKGVVNIRSGKKIPMSQLFVVFKKILHINGIDIRHEGDYEYIYMAKKPAAQVVRGADQIGDLEDSSRMVIQIIPILNLSSTEAQKLIEPYLSDHGMIYNMSSQNLLIIQDFESKVIDCVMVLARLDVSPLSSLKVSLIRIENAPLFDLQTELTEVLTAMGVAKQDYQSVSIVPLERVNSLLLVSSNEYMLKNVETWVKKLDIIPNQGSDNIYIYNVRNSVASELAELVNSLISEGGKGASSARKPITPKTTSPLRTSTRGTDRTTTTTPTTQPTQTRTVASAITPSSALNFAGEPMLIADDSRNIILLRALPPDYTRLLKILERLDNVPRQVMIEVLVAEVTLSDEWKFGIEWYVKNHGVTINDSGYSENFITNFSQVAEDNVGGFVYSLLSNNENVFGLLNALAADSDISILSSPQIMVLNNEAALINVGSEVPIVTTETFNENSANNSVDRTVQYKDTGVILNVTPRINYDGIIILDIDQEISEARQNTTGGIDSPEILKRQVKTKLAVKDGQSILIGGLISKNVDNSETGVPYIKDAPILGWLFKYQAETLRKTELLIMITPYVVESEDVLDQYISEFKKQVHHLKENIKN